MPAEWRRTWMKADLVLKVYALLMTDVVGRKYPANCWKLWWKQWPFQIWRNNETNLCSWMVNRLATASRTELHSALRLPCGVNTQVPPYFVEGHTLQKVKIIPIFLWRNCETAGKQSLSRSDLRESQCSSINEKKSLQSCCGAFTTERYFVSGMHVSGWTWFIRKR